MGAQGYDLSFNLDEGGGGCLRVEYFSTLHLWQLPPPDRLVSVPCHRDLAVAMHGRPSGGEGGVIGADSGRRSRDERHGGVAVVADAWDAGGHVQEPLRRESGKNLRQVLGCCPGRTRVREQAFVVSCLFDCGALGLVRARDICAAKLAALCCQHACARCASDAHVSSDGVTTCRWCPAAPSETRSELFRPRWASALV